jgi:hypothetical protein
MNRLMVALALALVVPACGGVDPHFYGWKGPASVPDATYSNGHPLILNASTNQTLEDQLFVAMNVHRLTVAAGALTRDQFADSLAHAYSKHMTVEPFLSLVDPEGDILINRMLRATGLGVGTFAHEIILKVSDPTAAVVLAAILSDSNQKQALEAADVNCGGVGIWFDAGPAAYYITISMFYR